MGYTDSTKQNEISRRWHLVDVKGEALGRAASKIAILLRGKNKPKFVPHLDMGDHVVVVNAARVKVTGNKKEQKMYKRYSGYPGGLKEKKYKTVMQENPEKIIKQAIAGMLPKNKLRKRLLTRLHISSDKKNPFKDKFKTN